MKKFFAILIAVAMLFTFTSVAFAANDGVITISNATPGQTYQIYRILDLETFNAETNSYSYKATADWEDFIADVNGTFVSVDGQGYVTWLAGDPADFATAAKEWAEENHIGYSRTANAPAAVEGETTSTVTFANLPLGYYLVDSTVGTVCSLDTTNKEVDINDKNEKPTLEKEVKEDSTDTWGEKNNAQIGETVDFRIKVTKQAGAINYVVHDKMEAGLTFKPDSVHVYGPDGVELVGNEFTLAYENLTDDCTFEVALANAYTATLEDDDTVVITYSAVLNEDAEIFGQTNDNDSWLKYGDNNDLSTTPDKTQTETYKFDLIKTNINNIVLEGAEFLLWADADKTTAIPVVLEDGEYRVAVAGETGVVITAGSVTINGLDQGTYYLEETKAPAGFNKINDVITVTIADGNNEGTVTYDPDTNVGTYDTTSEGVQVINNSGAELPSTGGMGTTLFYIVGAVLVAGAAIILFSRRRMAFAA